MKRIMYGGIVIGLFVFAAGSAYAAPAPVNQQMREQIREEKKTLMLEKKAAISEMPKRPVLKPALVRATVSSKSASSFVAKGSDGKEFTVQVDASTRWRRKFWGNSDFAELAVNDVVNIWGRWNNEEMTQIQAKLIRNISIQKRNGVFFGTVDSVSATGWVMSAVKRNNQTVTVSGSRFIDRTGNTITQSSVAVGHRVRVRGMWDSVNNTITEVKEVKDFTLPVKATPSPKP